MFDVAVCLPALSKPGWRNWQTRRIQNPLSERACGFKSHSGHRGSDPSSGDGSIPPGQWHSSRVRRSRYSVSERCERRLQSITRRRNPQGSLAPFAFGSVCSADAACAGARGVICGASRGAQRRIEPAESDALQLGGAKSRRSRCPVEIRASFNLTGGSTLAA